MQVHGPVAGGGGGGASAAGGHRHAAVLALAGVDGAGDAAGQLPPRAGEPAATAGRRRGAAGPLDPGPVVEPRGPVDRLLPETGPGVSGVLALVLRSVRSLHLRLQPCNNG